MGSLTILLIPPNDLLRHPIPNRLYHIGKRLARKHNIILLSYTGHPLANNLPVRYMNCSEVCFRPAVKVGNLGLYYIANALPIEKTLSDLLMKNHVDVIIHANILPSYIALKIANKLHIPSIYDYLDHFPESASAYYSNNITQKLVHGLTFNIIKYNLNASTHIVTVCYTLRNIITDIIKDKKKITIIPNGVDPQLFKPIPTEKARKKLNLDTYDHILLYYGSIDTWLDFNALFKTIKNLQHTIGKIVLIIMGISHNTTINHKLREYITKYNLHENIILLPAQPHEKVPLYINASDIIIAPYRKILKNYGTPLKILETLACAKPIITTNIIEFKLWLHETPVTFYEHEDELKDLIVKTLKSYDNIKSELIKTSEKIRNRFSWDKLAEQYEGLIKKLC